MRIPSVVLVFAAVSLAGCTAPLHTAGSFETAHPLPAEAAPGVAHAEGLFDGSGGIRLYEQSWRPATGEPRAVLVIVHGLKDHSRRYAEPAIAAAQRGFAVYAFDLRGHGDSGGKRVRIDSFDDYLNDLDRFMAFVKAKEPGKPVFLFGHSMGGAITTLWTITRQPDLAGLLLSGPALAAGKDLPKAKIAATKTLAAIAPTAHVLSLPDKNFSRDAAVVADMKADPLVYHDGGAARTAAELLRAFDRIGKDMDKVTVPLLVMHGTADKLTAPEGSKLLVEKSSSKDKTLKLYDGYYHDLLHEPTKATVLGDMLSWLDAHAPK